MTARLQLRVSPGASRSAVVGRHGSAWKVRVAAAPEAGRANDALVRLLADTLAVPARDVQIVSGHASRDKIVALEGVGTDEIEQRLALASRAGKEAKVSDTAIDAYRRRLEEERARLTEAVEFLERENAGSLGDELGEVGSGTDNHLGDTATATFDRELDGGLEVGAQQTLDDVEAALRKIEEGSYGTCEVCGEPIGAERLSAIPWARLCIDDQRRANA
jgi:DnaK suppressor protein